MRRPRPKPPQRRVATQRGAKSSRAAHQLLLAQAVEQVEHGDAAPALAARGSGGDVLQRSLHAAGALAEPERSPRCGAPRAAHHQQREGVEEAAAVLQQRKRHRNLRLSGVASVAQPLRPGELRERHARSRRRRQPAPPVRECHLTARGASSATRLRPIARALVISSAACGCAPGRHGGAAPPAGRCRRRAREGWGGRRATAESSRSRRAPSQRSRRRRSFPGRSRRAPVPATRLAAGGKLR